MEYRRVVHMQVDSRFRCTEANSWKAIIVGCLPPFRAIISTKPSSIQYRYGLSSANPASYPTLPQNNLHSTADRAEFALPTPGHRQYHNPDLEIHPLQDMHIGRGQAAKHAKSSREKLLEKDLRIEMVQEFVSFHSGELRLYGQANIGRAWYHRSNCLFTEHLSG